jgi:hypothetical protein
MSNTSNLPKLMVVGHGRHGKDTVCEYLADWYGFRHISSSLFVGEKAVFSATQRSLPGVSRGLADRYGVPDYDTLEDCYEDRANFRAFWFETIREYNAADHSRLGVELFQEYDVYCGLRSADEFAALKAKRAFDCSIWIDASKRKPPEGADSCTVTASMCDYVLDNNSTLNNLRVEIGQLMGIILLRHVSGSALRYPAAYGNGFVSSHG